MTLPVDPVPRRDTTGPIPGILPIGQLDPPIKEPGAERLPDEDSVPNPKENPDPPGRAGDTPY